MSVWFFCCWFGMLLLVLSVQAWRVLSVQVMAEVAPLNIGSDFSCVGFSSIVGSDFSCVGFCSIVGSQAATEAAPSVRQVWRPP